MTHSEHFTARGGWHVGEQTLQARLGVADRMAALGPRILRDAMPEQHRLFYAQLPALVLGAVDEAGTPWATVLEGPPGFIHSPDPRTLRVEALPGAGDPVRAALVPGAALGCLGIELPTRRRNRVNGRITAIDDHGFTMAVEQAFGNCPQYIQTRTPIRAASPPAPPPAISPERSSSLDDPARQALRAADTFFVASAVDLDGDPSRRAVDVSHRGGRPGFVRVDDDTLTIPDFAGNLHFNTLGNLLLNPRAGLVFLDFERGDLLQLSGATELVFAGPELDSFAGAERLWRLRVEQMVRRRGVLATHWSFGAASPQSQATGHW